VFDGQSDDLLAVEHGGHVTDYDTGDHETAASAKARAGPTPSLSSESIGRSAPRQDVRMLIHAC